MLQPKDRESCRCGCSIFCSRFEMKLFPKFTIAKTCLPAPFPSLRLPPHGHTLQFLAALVCCRGLDNPTRGRTRACPTDVREHLWRTFFRCFLRSFSTCFQKSHSFPSGSFSLSPSLSSHLLLGPWPVAGTTPSRHRATPVTHPASAKAHGSLPKGGCFACVFRKLIS